MTAFRRLGAIVTATAAFLLPASAAVAAPIEDPEEAAAYGAGWLLDQLDDDGVVPKPDGTPDYSATVKVAVALAATGIGEAEFDAIVDRLGADVDAYATNGGTDLPGALGRLAMLAYTAGEDPNAFGGTEPENRLLDRILATDTGPNPALFTDPGYNGLYNHALALLGLATGETFTAEQETDIEEALQLLVDQQCPNGGWQNDLRAAAGDGLAPCGTGFAGPDTNTTSLVVQALAAWDQQPGVDPLGYYDAAQNGQGGFGYVAGGETDANSTALSLQGILAAGGDPTAARFTAGDTDALEALLALQLTCDAAPADRGAWAFQPEPDGSLEANAFATGDAVPAAAGLTFPLDVADFVADDATMPCAAPTQSPTAQPAPTQVVRPRTAPSIAPTAVETLPETGAGLEKPWDAAGLAVFGGGLLGYGVIALVAARYVGRRRSG